MTSAVCGDLLPASVLRSVLPTIVGVEPLPAPVSRGLERLGERAALELGPACAVRQITDAVVLPLAQILGFILRGREDGPDTTRLELMGHGPSVVPLIVRAWTDDLGGVWREAVHAGVAADARWCLVSNGRVIRIVDAHQTWARRYLEIGISALEEDEAARHLLWTLAGARTLTTVPSVLDAAVVAAAAYGVEMNSRIGSGVASAVQVLYGALRPRLPQTVDSPRLLEQCLTVAYRVLFLLFAETRGLVPAWHPFYRDQYSISTMVDALAAGSTRHDAWKALHTIARLVHRGCEAGTLVVTAFNGRLFAPAQIADIEARHVSDRLMRTVLLDIGTTRVKDAPPVRTRFDELGVEHLGSVYERVLEYQPDRASCGLVLTRDTRKASGTFYTPRDIASFLVEQTLAPLVRERSADEILRLRVLDPAMGSGAFLVAACRYLAGRVEDALIREARWHAGEVSDADRAALRRDIVQRCLYGVDVNPVAVQLARLSLWLTALAGDKPLSFLDHRLVVGNSLVGASPQDLTRAPGGARRHPGRSDLPLFEDVHLEDVMAASVRVRRQLEREPDDTADIVRNKERLLAALVGPDAPLGAWRDALSFWCASWFWPSSAPPDSKTVREVVDHLLKGRSTLPAPALEALLASSRGCAERWGFLHWPLTFPEVFEDTGERPPGFDAVIGNPPWDMVRGDAGDEGQRRTRRDEARLLTRFFTLSGLYQRCARAHVNRYALFTERALHLVRDGGRVGLLLPGGVLTDAGVAPLRARLFDTTAVDAIVGFDNRSSIFPIHRSVKFVLLTTTAGPSTGEVRCRFGLTDTRQLENVWSAERTVRISRRLLERVSGGDDMAVPELIEWQDLRILESVTARCPRLGDPDGWGARFGRELNATDDRHHMTPCGADASGRRVVEGKMLRPFQVHVHLSRMALTPDGEASCAIPFRARLAYREVAGATNRTTLIAAIVPATAVTSHSVFCLKGDMPGDHQLVLAALLNSYVANFLVRLRVTTHVTATIMSKLRVPLVAPSSPTFARLRRLAAALTETADVESHPAHAALQATVARLYELDAPSFTRVLETFPLVPRGVRDECFRKFVQQ